MTPSGPPPVTGSEPPIASIPFWSYLDLAFVVSLCIPALFVAALAVRALRHFASMSSPLQGMAAQLIWYALVFCALSALFHLRYKQPFWRSLGWKIPFRGMVASFFAGPLVAIAIGYLGYLMHAPEITQPFDKMLGDRLTLVSFAIFAVVLGPVAEELAFRGFLMPLLIRSLGVVAGIVVTGLLFGSLHAYMYLGSWRHVLLISLAGAIFGWIRHKSGSTAASTFMHSTYNLAQLAGFLVHASTP